VSACTHTTDNFRMKRKDDEKLIPKRRKRDSCFLFYLRCTTTTAYRRLNYFLIPHPSWNYSHLVASHFSASRFDYALVFFSFFPGLRAYRLTTGVVQPGDSQMTHIREKYIPIHTRGLDLNSFKYYRKGVNMSKIRVFVCVPGLI
jgi:hypothetical protein